MTKAEELFLKAGFSDRYTDLNNNYLIYSTGKPHGCSVTFDLKYKEFTPIYDNDYMAVEMDLFKAIQAQIEELGWDK